MIEDKMDDLRMIKLDCNTDLWMQTAVRGSLDRIFANPPTEEYNVDMLYDSGNEFKPDPKDPSRVYWVMGRSRSIDDLLGFAECYEGKAGSSILDASIYGSWGKETNGYLCRRIGEGDEEEDFETVPNDELVRAPGYSLYTGKGDVLHLSYLHMLLQRRGFGTRFMDLLKKHGYELIELSAVGEGLRDFYLKNDFLETELYNDGMPVFVWNNQEFSK